MRNWPDICFRRVSAPLVNLSSSETSNPLNPYLHLSFSLESSIEIRQWRNLFFSVLSPVPLWYATESSSVQLTDCLALHYRHLRRLFRGSYTVSIHCLVVIWDYFRLIRLLVRFTSERSSRLWLRVLLLLPLLTLLQVWVSFLFCFSIPYLSQFVKTTWNYCCWVFNFVFDYKCCLCFFWRFFSFSSLWDSSPCLIAISGPECCFCLFFERRVCRSVWWGCWEAWIREGLRGIYWWVQVKSCAF